MLVEKSHASPGGSDLLPGSGRFFIAAKMQNNEHLSPGGPEEDIQRRPGGTRFARRAVLMSPQTVIQIVSGLVFLLLCMCWALPWGMGETSWDPGAWFSKCMEVQGRWYSLLIVE
jgi:hypothetical protein